VFGFEKKEKVNKERNILYKGLTNSRINIVQKRRLDVMDCECEAQTIDRQSTVDKPLVAAVHDDMDKIHIGRQNQGVESNYLSFDGITCLALKTDSEGLNEKANHFIRSRRKYVRSSVRKMFKKKMINQRNLIKSVQECEVPTFNYDSTVGKSLVAAVHDHMDKIHIGRQSQDAESSLLSIHRKICRRTETDQKR
jgi:hypothetical protein